MVPGFMAWLASGFWSEVIIWMFLTCTPGGTALVLLCRLRKHAAMDLPASVEALLVLLVSGLGFAISCMLFCETSFLAPPHFGGFLYDLGP